MTEPDHRLHSPAAERNAAAIAATLQRLLPARGRLLELAAGSGQHAAAIAPTLPGWQWQPTEADPRLLASIAAWTQQRAAPNVLPPVALDVMAPWPVGPGWDAVYCANLLHIAPWPVCAALMAGAAAHLGPAGMLLIYGPFIEPDVPTAPSNQAFDADLRLRARQWGLRHLDAVRSEASNRGLRLRERVAMPANNLLLAFDRQPSA